MRNRIETLKIVFLLGDPIKTEIVNLGKSELKLETLSQPLEAIDALEKIIEVMKVAGQHTVFKTDTGMIPLETLRREAQRKGRFHTLACNDLSFEFGVVASKKHLFVQISENVPNAAGNWADWIRPFCDVPGFVQAWVADSDYEYWQNAADLLQYKVAARETSHLPLVSNGLPPPLLRQVVDTSKNPGRWRLRDGYVEAIGATMWLGNTFFALTKGIENRDKVCSTDWLPVTPVADGVIKVMAYPTSFCNDSTAPIQDKLRSLLYIQPLPGD